MSEQKHGRLVLFGGQSNMLGHAKSIDGKRLFNCEVYAWSNGGAHGRWALAELGKAPFNPVPGSPNNVALHFADHLQHAVNEPVYIIGHAVNGAAIKSWSSSSSVNMARLISEVDHALRLASLQDVTFGGVECLLWHQGEGDDPDATMVDEPKARTLAEYAEEFGKMVETLKTKPWWTQGKRTLIAGELARDGWFSARNDFYGRPDLWPKGITMRLASSEDLDDIGDRVHFRGAALATLGERMFAEWRKLQGSPAIFFLTVAIMHLLESLVNPLLVTA